MICCVTVQAQVNGVILNAKGKPAKNITVKKKNTKQSVNPGKDGSFTLTDISTGDTLVVEVSKREDAVIPIGNTGDMTIVLQRNNFTVSQGDMTTTLEYQRKKSNLHINNIITREQIEEMSVTNIYDILRYNIQGVKVIDDTEGSKIIIRNNPMEPLFVVDGIYFDSSAAVDIRVSATDIERIEILREGEGYGYRGGNGVIVISTRK